MIFPTIEPGTLWRIANPNGRIFISEFKYYPIVLVYRYGLSERTFMWGKSRTKGWVLVKGVIKEVGLSQFIWHYYTLTSATKVLVKRWPKQVKLDLIRLKVSGDF